MAWKGREWMLLKRKGCGGIERDEKGRNGKK